MTVRAQLDLALPVDQAGIDYAAALASFEESSKILHVLVAQDPTNTDLRARLENILIRIGDLYLARGIFADCDSRRIRKPCRSAVDHNYRRILAMSNGSSASK